MEHEKICSYCGDAFVAKRKDAKFCSPSCRGTSYAKLTPDYEKDRYARLKSDPKRWSATQNKQHENYLANREERIERAAERQAYHPKDKKRYNETYQHGRTKAELFSELWNLQEGRCYLCGDELVYDTRKVHIDHDHRCCRNIRTCQICRRGLACPDCNHAIGWAKDDPERLHRIADNLAKAIALVDQRLSSK